MSMDEAYLYYQTQTFATHPPQIYVSLLANSMATGVESSLDYLKGTGGSIPERRAWQRQVRLIKVPIFWGGVSA